MNAQNQSKANRKRRFRALAMLMLPLALIFASFNAPTTAAQNSVEAIYDLKPKISSLSNLPSTEALAATGTTFYVQGDVYPFRTINQATCEFNVASPRVVGTWRAWGTIADDGRVVIKISLTLDCCGATLEIQGTSGLPLHAGDAAPALSGTFGEPFTGPSEVLSVVGGAGQLRGFNGEAQVRPYCQAKSDIGRPFRYDRAFCLGYLEGRRR
jgi:hypothetical protein